MRRVVVFALCVACSRASADEEPPIAWKPPADAVWEQFPKNDDAARALTERVASSGAPMLASPNKLRAFDMDDLVALRADATRLVAGEAQIAAAYDAWMNADGAKPAYVIFGTLHDSRAQIETVASIVFRMKAPWGFALEQFRARGKWKGAPDTPSADDADLALLAKKTLDEGALWRVTSRQNELDHAAWKFGYVASMTNLIYASRGASMPLVACDMPVELRKGFTTGGDAESALRELHCARSIRSAAIAAAPLHPPPSETSDAGLTDDDPMPPERYAILVGANHAAPTGLPRFLHSKTSRIVSVRVLGGRPRDAGGEESELASRFVVMDPVLVRGERPGFADTLLIPDDAWSGTIERTTDQGSAPLAPATGLPRHNVLVSSDEPARFAIGDASISLAGKSEWLSVRSGHEPFVLTTSARTMIGAIDVPDAGYAEAAFSPNARAVRLIIHKSK